jgi:23S rRNA (guanine2445-N2)-methyltransferase / 23S rRNA (guanine2069-N7)-methyltransferase
MKLFCTCPKGLETLLEEELKDLGAEQVKVTNYGVYCDVTQEKIYEICLWSRLANRVLLPLVEFDCLSAADLYAGTQQIDWLLHMEPELSMAVDFSGTNEGITNTVFGAQKVKDAVVDQIREKTGVRPTVQALRPDLRVNAHLRKGKATISLDLSGESLHMRGYRTEAGVAPLKENLACAILLRAGVGQLRGANHQTRAVIDPMCGSGTLLIEAAMILADRAPGLSRDYFGFFGWKSFDPSLWGDLKDVAFDRFEKGMSALNTKFFGYDWSANTLDTARRNADRAGLGGAISFIKQPLRALQKPSGVQGGLIVCNPPYGARIGEVSELKELYRELGETVKVFAAEADSDIDTDIKEESHGRSPWEFAVFTGNTDLFAHTRWRYLKKYKLSNGTIPCELFLVDLKAASFKDDAALMGGRGKGWQVVHPERAAMFANRLKKNVKSLSKWLAKSGISCYRLYDADMPEYAMAIDVYQDWYHIQEYVAPKSIDPESAQERFLEALAVIRDELNVNPGKMIYKRRQRQSGDSQYEKVAGVSQKFEVNEYGVRVLVNLTDYLDTGLFLDHRPVRKWIQDNAAGKRFLNLFCYTGVATLHAVKGGATSSVSVDMSNTYLGWAKENLALNGFSGSKHLFERADCMEWVKGAKGTFDLIFLDPPTFSNSKKMQGIFDVQRDHGILIDECMRLLDKQGVLVFSNNLRKFSLDDAVTSKFDVQEITDKTIDQDFKRNAGIHHCWIIRGTH